MGSPNITLGPALWVATLTLVLIAAGVAGWAGLGTGRDVLTAAARAVVQLAAIALLLRLILDHLLASVAFLVVMVAVASATAARRLTRDRTGRWAAVPVVAAAVPITAGLVLGGAVPARGVAVIPVAGILIGGAMTATVLAGRRALDDLAVRRGEVEAARALGLLDRDAAIEIARPAAAQALIPGLDQTRTVGLVTLPGAFVGMLLGGATVTEAAAVQLLVLVGLLAVQAMAVAVTVELICRARIVRS